MSKNPPFLIKLFPWLVGFIVIVGIPLGYLTYTGKTIWDLVFTSEITISDGNVVKKYSNGKEIIIVNKDDFEDDGINRFIHVVVSPDKEKICFLGQTVAPIWSYWSNVDGSNPTQIGVSENCVWSNSSEKISYTNHTTDISPHNVYSYALSSKELINLTESVNSLEEMRVYEAPKWSDDDTYVTSDYKQYNFNMELSSEGTTKITIDTGELEEI